MEKIKTSRVSIMVVIEDVVQRIDYSKMSYNPSAYPIPGKYYITGPQVGNSNPMQRVGYVVQVRLKGGAFGSHCVLMRNPDGGLSSHANQCYCAITEDDVERIRAVSECLFEDEDYTRAYSIAGEHHEIGQVIEFNHGMHPTIHHW